MLRFAFSPTEDMYIDDLRVALLNYIVSKQKNEDFIVRIEETDKEKNIESKEQEMLEILGLFGIEYSQIIRQSQNFRFHSAMAIQLLHEKKAFSCFCSDEWLEKKRDEAKKAQKEYQYDDACRNLPPELVIDNTAPFRVRIVRPDTDTIDSFVIMEQDKNPTYDFACAVDDMLSDISMIIINDSSYDNTTKQIHVRHQLGYDKEIEYAHLPAIQDKVSVKQLLEEGYLPEAISNYLILISVEPEKEIFTLEEAIKWFNVDKTVQSPARFDLDMLKHINQEHLKNLDAIELSRYVGFADADIGELARLYIEEASTTKELKEKIAPIFAARDIAEESAEQTALMTEVIKDAPYFEEYNDFKNYIIKETQMQDKDFSKYLRILFTNADHGPDIAEIYKHLKNYIKEIVK